MNRPILLLAAAMFLAIWPPTARAADSPPAPASGVLDPEGFFTRNPEALGKIVRRSEMLEKDHGFRIYLAVQPAVLSSTVPALATQFRQDWLPAGDGLVLVFESDTRRLGAGGNPTEPPDGNHAPAAVPFPETTGIFARVLRDRGQPPETAADLADFVDALATEYEAYFARRSQPPPRERSLRMLLLVAGALAVLGLFAIATGGWMKHHAATAGARFRFPPSDLPERLGAPAGAAVTARRFSGKARA